MLELCKINRLRVLREKPQGVYLGESEDANKSVKEDNKTGAKESSLESSNESAKGSAKGSAGASTKEDVLLPRKEIPEGLRIGDELDVFLYLDSSDRITATLKTPYICLGGLAILKVVQVTEIGVFLDWGLDKNLMLPFKEVVSPLMFDPAASGETSAKTGSDKRGIIREGMSLPVVLYIDRSGRPAATMHVYDHLQPGEKYVKDSAVEATVIQINPELGVFVAVDDRYFGMINISEVVRKVNVGDKIFGRVSDVRDDGKYMISLTQKAHLQMDNDAQVVFSKLQEAGGSLPIGDKSDAADIMRELGMSKKAFKRAVGQLYKNGKIAKPEESHISFR